MPIGNREENLNRAIICFKEALRFWTPEKDPLDYALVQRNLGDVYSKLPTGDQKVNLNRAIDHYKEALCFCTSENNPFQYADTQFQFGNACIMISKEHQENYMDQAISCFENDGPQSIIVWSSFVTILTFNFARLIFSFCSDSCIVCASVRWFNSARATSNSFFA